MYPVNPLQDKPEIWSKIEPLLCDCTIQELRSIGSLIHNKASDMSQHLDETVTVDDFNKRMKSDTQAITTIMKPSGSIQHDNEVNSTMMSSDSGDGE